MRRLIGMPDVMNEIMARRNNEITISRATSTPYSLRGGKYVAHIICCFAYFIDDEMR